MMLRFLLLAYLFAQVSVGINAQGHIPVFPQWEEERLVEALQDSFTTSTVLDYDRARDTLFKNIWQKQDTLEAIYTGYSIYLNPALDPTIDAFDKDINTEHSWPRSMGANEGNANSDMHHLFPSLVSVNADRGNLPFANIEDQRTQFWYHKKQKQQGIPSQRDMYSELGNGFFEPRESVKGDIARAQFYFYTIYRDAALVNAGNYFDIARESLCEWHLQDPVDEKEWNRNLAIARYQDNKANPFILDCTLAHRTYCADYRACQPISFQSNSTNLTRKVKAFPNPSHGRLTLSFQTPFTGWLHLIHSDGTEIDKIYFQEMKETSIHVADLPSGIYILQFMEDQNFSTRTYLRWVKL